MEEDEKQMEKNEKKEGEKDKNKVPVLHNYAIVRVRISVQN